jgi:antitoxin CptB
MLPENEETIRRKRLSYRAWHRGMKEMDLILGQFADARLTAMSEVELDAFETVLTYSDVALYRWLTGAEVVPEHYDSAMLREVLRSVPGTAIVAS